MSVETETPKRDRSHVLLYAIITGVLMVLTIWALLAYSGVTENGEARQKADRTIDALSTAGLPTPSRDFLVRTLGSDGGFPCRDPGGALEKAVWNLQLTNGAAQVGVRPVLVTRNLVRTEEIVLGVYCPEQLPALQGYRDSLRYATS